MKMRMPIKLGSMALTALLALSGCAEPPAAVPSAPVNLAASGTAVLVSRGFAREGGMMPNTTSVVGGKMFLKRAGDRANVDILSPTGGWAHDTGLYHIQVVPAGTYQLGGVSHGTTWANTKGLDPLSRLALAPGEVVYIGDIDLRSVPISSRSFRAEARISDHTAEARAALGAQYPQLASQMQTRLFRCAICVAR